MSRRWRLDEESPLNDIDPDIHILVEGHMGTIPAHYALLMLYSTCVKNLPRATDGTPTTWDLRALVLEGESQPVGAEVVERWLDLVYARVDRRRHVVLSKNLADVKPLLLFADAAGTSGIALDNLCCRLLDIADLHLTVPLDNEHRVSVELVLQGRVYYILNNRSLEYVDVPYTQCIIVDDAFDDACRARFPGAVAAVLEEWLHLVSRLRLVSLARLLINFIKAQLVPCKFSILGSAVGAVYSPRVLQCMPHELLLESFLRDALTDLPTRLQLAAEPVTLTCTSPAAAAWFERSAGSNVELAALETEAGRTMLRSDEFAELPLNTTMGGLKPEVRASVMAEALAKVMLER